MWYAMKQEVSNLVVRGEYNIHYTKGGEGEARHCYTVQVKLDTVNSVYVPNLSPSQFKKLEKHLLQFEDDFIYNCMGRGSNDPDVAYKVDFVR